MDSVQKLVKIYKAARERLIAIVLEKSAQGNAVAYQLRLIKQLDAEIQRLNLEAQGWAQQELPAEYYSAIDDVNRYLKDVGLASGGAVGIDLAALHKQAVETIVANTVESLVNANNYVGRQWRDKIRQLGLEASANKFAAGQTWQQMRREFEKALIDSRLNGIRRRDGRVIPLDAYAELVARSTTAEATNRAALNQLVGLGYDLVQLTAHSPACRVCAPLQGRVYSISGRHPGFPPLSRAHSGPYANIHPNCRHRLVPYVKDRFSDEESRRQYERDKAFSNRPFDVDERSEKEKAAYESALRRKRHLREDRKEFGRYKARLGEDAPKSFSAFRRIKKAGGETWKLMQLDYRRRSSLAAHPETMLPDAYAPVAADTKFTGYLFNPANKAGYAKGVAITSRLGYNINNWQELQKEILSRARLYPAVYKRDNAAGVKLYEQFQILYGLKNKPANLKVIWGRDEAKTWMVTCMIEEVE